jgi:FkbM family methyltransferase
LALLSAARCALTSSRRLRRAIRHRRTAGSRLLRAFARAYPRAFFIEIGANDGGGADHLQSLIRSNPWRGILVEPNPRAFERLRENYADLGRVELANVAIAGSDGRLPFFEIEPPEDPASWELLGEYDRLGSLSREVLLGHDWIKNVDRRVVRTEVDALTFESLCRRHRVERVDLLVIDTEGYDFEIVRQLDLADRRPRLLVYEHGLLTAEERKQCRVLMRKAGYELLEEWIDTWCLDTTVEDRLTARWRRLRPTRPSRSLRGKG